MDIPQAIRVFHISYMMTRSHLLSQQEKQHYEAERQQLQEAEKICENYANYLQFTRGEGRTIALAAVELFDVGVEGRFQYLPHIILENLARTVPGALQGLYTHLIARNLFWGDGVLYWEANSGARDLLLTFLETDLQDILKRHDLLCALAWIGDEKVREQFDTWRHSPPVWHTTGNDSMQKYARYAGWELTEEGKRHNLCSQVCYDLLSVDAPLTSSIQHPIAVIAPREDHCPWCGRPLVTLFDLHLHDRRLSFLPLQGKRLHIPICINCSLQERVFFDVDEDGASHWSESNGKLPRLLTLYEDDVMPPWPQQQLVLGKIRKTPYVNEGSHLGGYPAWVQDPQYPRCPICQQTMHFVGQLEPAADVSAPASIEGIVYAFVCTICRKTTTVYQQT